LSFKVSLAVISYTNLQHVYQV